MKKKSFVVITILLILVILGLCAFIAYDKNLFDIKNKKNNQEKAATETNLNDQNKIYKPYVVDLINDRIDQKVYQNGVDITNTLEERENPGVELVLPKINIDSKGAESINDKIAEEYKEQINTIKNKVDKQEVTIGPYRVTADYSYTVKNNVIFIIINHSWVNYRAGGSSIYKGYYYDIESGRELNINEVLSKLGFAENDVMKEINELYPNEGFTNAIFNETVIYPFTNEFRLYLNVMGIECPLYTECGVVRISAHDKN